MRAHIPAARCKTAHDVFVRVACSAAVLGVLLVATVSPCRGDSPRAVPSALDAHLAAGEFGPARQLALHAGTDQQRDQQLRKIAAAQLAAGARAGALQTAAEIDDGYLREQTLATIRPAYRGAAGRQGGGPQADFDSLINLITSTIEPDTWDEVGGDGSIAPFETGVRVDARGLMSLVEVDAPSQWLSGVRQSARSDGGNQDIRRASRLRKVSLPRLERQVQLRWAQGLPPTQAMRALAGLRRVRYLLVYPDTGDLVLAGPAGDWQSDSQGRAVGVEDGAPVLVLDDLVVVLRNALDGIGRFGCAITPRRENLAKARAFITESAKQPIKPGQRRAWLTQLRDQLGRQDIDVYGIDPRTRAAHVIVEADYHMKLIGMGLADGVVGVTGYLDSIQVAPGEAPPPLGVLRWWFALNYRSIQSTPARNAFQLQGTGVKVQSENELLSLRGERIHTGKSEQLNQLFAARFTRHFEELAAAYPIYAELRNVFDLAMVSAVMCDEDLVARVGWAAAHFRNPKAYQVAGRPAPRQVESVVNHRVIQRKYVVAGVSGGVAANPTAVLKQAGIRTAPYGPLYRDQAESGAPANLPPDRWWWD